MKQEMTRSYSTLIKEIELNSFLKSLNFRRIRRTGKTFLQKKMPKVSTRKQTLIHIDDILFYLIIEANPENEEAINELIELKAQIL